MITSNVILQQPADIDGMIKHILTASTKLLLAKIKAKLLWGMEVPKSVWN